MSNLAPQKINLSYSGLLQVPGGLTSSLQYITDGNGVSSGLQISTTGFAGTIVSDTVTITGGTINGTAIGATNPSSGRFSSLTVSALTGLLKGSSGAVSTATANTDYLTPPSGTAILKANSGGALANATSGVDYAPATSGSSVLSGNGSGGFTNVSIGPGLTFVGSTISTTTGLDNTKLLASNGLNGFTAVTVGSGLQYSGGVLASTSGGGSVTTVSVVSANGFTGTVANASSTPAITLATSITGLLKGNGTAISAASAGTDYAPATSGASILYGNGSGGFSNVTIGSGLSFAAGTLSASINISNDTSTATTLYPAFLNATTGTAATLYTGNARLLYTPSTGLLQSTIVQSNANQIGQSLTANQNFSWYQPSTPDGTVRLGVGNAGVTTLDAVTVNNSGNVGIGTSSPVANHQLTIKAPTSNYVQIALVGGDTSSQWDVSAYNDGSQFFIGYANSPKLRLDSSGNLGLGVTPSASSIPTFQVGTAVIVGNSETDITSNAYYNGGWKYVGTGLATQYQANGGLHKWFTAPSGTAGNAISFTQAMTLDASGNLLVGTTALYGTGGISLDATGFEGTGQIRFNRTARATISYPMDFRNGGTAVGYISYTNTATTYTTSSDLRLKTNIAPAGSAIQSILDFPVDQFDWISTGEHQDFGAVAQKAINVIPEMVSVPEDPDEMWGIDWSKAVPRLIKTIQELTAELNELKQKVNA